MPRRSKVGAIMERYGKEIERRIINGDFIDAVGIFDPIPPREKIRDELKKPPINILDRSFRIIKVEDIGNYKIFIQIPGEKSEYDFFVWRAIYIDNRIDLKIPSYDDLGRMYLTLKHNYNYRELKEYLINATLRFIRDRWPLREVLNRYFASIPQQTKDEVKKFLLTLKWLAIEEDANYPPPQHLGSLFPLSVFAVLEVTNDLSSIRRIINFRGR
jgi:mRNA-degrading endonuclease HigB of HigAB toxin-antitoxin module